MIETERVFKRGREVLGEIREKVCVMVIPIVIGALGTTPQVGNN